MRIVIVEVSVKADCIESFKAETRKNAQASVKEDGIARFDVIQNEEDPSQFILIEAYSAEDGPKRHKETDHYLAWRAAVEPMMAAPRKGTWFSGVFPHDADW